VESVGLSRSKFGNVPIQSPESKLSALENFSNSGIARKIKELANVGFRGESAHLGERTKTIDQQGERQERIYHWRVIGWSGPVRLNHATGSRSEDRSAYVVRPLSGRIPWATRYLW